MTANVIDQTFQHLKKRHRKALIAYLAAGYPDFTQQKQLIKTMVAAGVDILELGIPFSDPIADGPTIQFASQESLKNGTSLRKVLKFVRILKKDIAIPIVLMGYMNPIYQYGFKKFSQDAASAGVSGIIIPDLIPEESKEMRTVLAKNNIHLIHLLAPTTPSPRQHSIAQKTKGFLYAVSTTGVTGARSSFPPETKNWLGHLKLKHKVPVCVGFGLSQPRHLRMLKNNVDGFIVGSALIDLIRRTSIPHRLKKMKNFVTQMSRECDDYGRS